MIFFPFWIKDSSPIREWHRLGLTLKGLRLGLTLFNVVSWRLLSCPLTSSLLSAFFLGVGETSKKIKKTTIRSSPLTRRESVYIPVPPNWRHVLLALRLILCTIFFIFILSCYLSSFLSIFLPFFLSFFLSVCLSVYLSVFLSFFFLASFTFLSLLILPPLPSSHPFHLFPPSF